MNHSAFTPLSIDSRKTILRALWLLVALGVVALVLSAAPLRYQMLLRDKDGFETGLQALGLSLAFFAGYFTAWELTVVVASLLVAGLIIWKRADDGFAMLVAISLTLFGLLPPLIDGLTFFNPQWAIPISTLRMVEMGCLMAVCCLFPSGRFTPRWTSWLLLLWLLFSFSLLMMNPTIMADTSVLPNTRPPESARWLLIGVGWFSVAIVGQVIRYRQHATPTEKRQMKLVLFGFVVVVMLSLISALLLAGWPEINQTPQFRARFTLVMGALYLLSAIALPVEMALSMLFARLWDVDILLNRTLVYGGLTTLVTAVYVFLVGGFGVLAVNQQGEWVGLVVATAFSLVLLRPLYSRFQTFADRLIPIPRSAPSTPLPLKPVAWFPLIRVVAWVAIFFLWATWLLGAWFYVRAIPTDLDTLLHLQFGYTDWTVEALHAAAAALGIPLTLFAWLWFSIELVLVATFGAAGVILFRYKQDSFGAFLGVALVLIATRIGGPVTFTLYFQWPALELPSNFLSGMAFVAFGALLYLFPDGRFVPAGTRWLPLLMSLSLVWTYVREDTELSAVFSLVYLGVGLAGQVYRYRRLSDIVARRHIRWIIASFAAFVGVILVCLLIAPNAVTMTHPPSPGDYLASILVSLAITAASISFVIALSVAILRDGLYNLNILINRALVYGGLTVVIIAFYALVVGGLSLVFRAQNNLFLSLLATGFIAVFFQPVRERLQRGANRLLYGDRDDPYRVLSRLGRQLQETAIPGHLLPAITQTISQTLKLPYVAVALHTGEEERRLAALTGQPSTVIEEWPLLHQGELVGWLIVAPRSPQEPFTDRERQLLADIAGQAGAAAYSDRLTTALQRSRERLVLAGEEERRRIRRDLHDGLGPTLASQTFKLDAALELLETDPDAAANVLLSLKSQNQGLIADIRRLVYALRPPSLDELGLLVALQVHISQMSLGHNGLKVTVAAAPDPLPPLPAAVEVAAYRIALEGLTNVVRHAQASQCQVTVEHTTDHLIITITDDGHGLPPETQPGVGLTSMRERTEELGGQFTITRPPTGGTNVTAILPLLSTQMGSISEDLS